MPIHGFCARVLRSRPLAAGLDPRFGVLEASRPAVDLAAAYAAVSYTHLTLPTN